MIFIVLDSETNRRKDNSCIIHPATGQLPLEGLDCGLLMCSARKSSRVRQPASLLGSMLAFSLQNVWIKLREALLNSSDGMGASFNVYHGHSLY